jgi:translation initiation factor IF-3
LSRPFSPRSFQPREPLHRRNGKIRAREVRVIDDNKQQLGIISLDEALKLARSKGMDLIEVVASATPPVCRIMEYGKFLYEESKRGKASQASRPANKMKELQISPAIDPHDLETKLDHAIGFLCEDMKVRVKLRFRGRQRAHKEIGFDVMNKFVRDVALYGQADSPVKMLGERDLNVTLSPLPRNKRAKSPKQLKAHENAEGSASEKPKEKSSKPHPPSAEDSATNAEPETEEAETESASEGQPGGN